MVRSMTLRSVKSAMACACPGVRSGSKISTLASSCMARISTSSSLPRPIRYLGSASGRRCSTTPITRTPAVRHSSLQLLRRAPPGPCPRPARRPSRGARPPPPARHGRAPSVATAAGATRSNSSSSAATSARRPARCGETARSAARATASGLPLGGGGSRWATCRSAGRPSGCTPIAATRSSRSSARSTRSSRVSGSLRRWVCTSRSPRKRPRPARMRPISGRSGARRRRRTRARSRRAG